MAYGYSTSESAAAMMHYRELEQLADISAAEDVVLVHARSIQELRKAYPNYFMDTRRLVRELDILAPYTQQKQPKKPPENIERDNPFV